MRRFELVAGSVLGAALVVHLWEKVAHDTLWEVLWTCNAAALLIVLGVFTDRRAPTSVGWLSFAAIGVWLWALDLAAGGATTPASVAVHVAAPVVGLLHIRRVKLWRRVVPAAFVLQLLLSAAARWLSPAELNVNVAHDVWAPVAAWFGDMWTYQVANFALCALLLQCGYAACRRANLVEGAPHGALDDG